MSEFWNYLQLNYTTIGVVLGSAVTLLWVTFTIISVIREPEPIYILNMEIGPISRLVFMLIVSIPVGAITAKAWIILVPLAVIVTIIAFIVWFRQWREDKRVRRENGWV